MSSLLSSSTSFYTPSTAGSLERAASLAFDFQKVKAKLVGSTTRDEANAIYETGAYCLSYAELSLHAPLTHDIPAGVVVKGRTTSSGAVEGRILQRATAGESTLQVQYLFTEPGPSGPTLCSVGGNLTPLVDQCTFCLYILDGRFLLLLQPVPFSYPLFSWQLCDEPFWKRFQVHRTDSRVTR